MAQPAELRNPFYFLLLLASLLFTVNAVALAVIPVIEEKARDAGEPPPPDPFRDALRNEGYLWLLYEVGAIILLALLSMGLDRLRRLQKERAQATIPPANDPSSSP
ncbi:MAG: hypothetical protein L0Z62_48940 [Gemmataceae bacterium]|nr:hypothetical protein [Gemmataceae bacterium]